ncbi:MAM and LDL-receptor class A domain-containing protein 1 [Eurytemora carolleeae]|uniref:MAM and LDL-receptor class A domain-containing protein 1 n=1 Tax=Eurytemora carolleeae TaxID=1294199 RepID=UPI000C757933|nr:MAM and LDL-receptor class A domain-containing protein 1 [Eurytemora carolleeae]|eukprot:XP_023328229.1 MAM and LDL-receptor class A domain-containing protein 1-like [Eurytemora affinis]
MLGFILTLICSSAVFGLPQLEKESEPTTVRVGSSVGRQFPALSRNPEDLNTAANCDFKSDAEVSMCGWDNLGNATVLKWIASKGADAYWIGGPRTDTSVENENGGYVFFETSTLPQAESTNTVSAMIESPLLGTTGSRGHCVTFSYAISGLSADRLRILLHPVDYREDPDSADFSNDVVLASLLDDTRGAWKSAKVMYTFPEEHTLIIEAIPVSESNQARRYRGYMAVDDIVFKAGDECSGHCTFDSGLCGFKNEAEGNFNWEVGRGSNNPNTGPQRDHSSFSTNRITGAFAFIDASYPRRPDDRALLTSEEFPPTDEDDQGPLCLRFWTHMFGNGIGSLNVYVRDGETDRKIWGLTGDAGNNWYMGQAPISSIQKFKIVFEGVVGRNSLGNIAIDDISIAPGVCPTAPQVAAPALGDCAFEDDECGWSNPEKRENVDELDWERSAAAEGARFPLADHTTGTDLGFFIQLSKDNLQKAGDRAFFVSRELEGSSIPRCLSFWFYMYEPIVDNTGPNLGKLAVWTRTIDSEDNLVMTPVWRLHNGFGPSWAFAQTQISTDTTFQVVIEGVWGNNRASGFIAVDDVTFYQGNCVTVPEPASIVTGECTFDRDSCGWKNSSNGESFDWRMATLTKRPANLPDKTYGAPVGYAYFDIFNTGSRTDTVRMISPVLQSKDSIDQLCFSFWFAAFGAGESTLLKIYSKDDGEDSETEGESDVPIWELNAAKLDTARPDWEPAQVSVNLNRKIRLLIVGEASNGGFAIDQLTFSPGACKVRPESAVPAA